jgi:hypothetical protein
MVKREKASLGEGDIENTNQGVKNEAEKKGKEDKKNERLGEINVFKSSSKHTPPFSPTYRNSEHQAPISK